MAEAPFVEAKHKFKKDWVLTYEEVFEKRYGYYIPLMKRFEEYLGREQLIDMIKRATDESIMAEASDGADFDFRKWLEGGDEYFANMMTWEVVEWTETVYEMRVSECLWCEIFKQEDAAHIGYATVCYSDFASAKATHPNLRLERTKTIMQGDGYCNHRWILDT
ncbi:MAG: L-2-amino-thiazoline-4-carboxylic acid hydrolase [bacterium]|nr:L-2-amino-thiazoline-4-carboxylic acid hydrolase [bacterium]